LAGFILRFRRGDEVQLLVRLLVQFWAMTISQEGAIRALAAVLAQTKASAIPAGKSAKQTSQTNFVLSNTR
jgi:hypothetical protein